METILKELETLQEEIDQAKTDLARAEGGVESGMKRLKDEFNLDSIKDAEKELKNMDKNLSALKVEIETKFNSMKEKWEW